MDRFLVNMAIVKVNFDKSGADILDNYIPLVRETLDALDNEVVSVDDFKMKFTEISEFKMPTGAILSLLKRAEKKYSLLEKQKGGEYKIKRENINSINYLSTRDSEQRRYNSLVSKFIDFCSDNLDVKVDERNASSYFFEVLYDIAPSLFFNINDIDDIKLNHSEKNKYLVAKFISYINKCDQDSFEAILSFVRGSMLTETFYYSQSFADISNKPLKRVVVYFDTQFLIRLLGFSVDSICIPCKELHEMLRDMQVKMKCFRQTFDEMHGILLAAVNQLNQYGRLKPNKPGDVFDYFNQINITHSDLLLLIGSMEEKLSDLGINIEEKPEILEVYSIDEVSLKQTLQEAFEFQSEKARNHDIDCLQSVFQIREGQPQNYLDRCKAIFITTNAKLARLSTLYFNEKFGISNAPVCMADNVFTSLVWMKAVKKTPDIPKDRLVANCYSALLPTESLWSEYIKEVNKLKDKGTISESDYHVLIHSITAREHLMDQAFSSDDNIFGSVEQILEKAKRVYTEELGKRLTEVESDSAKQNERIESISESIKRITSKMVLVLILVLWGGALGYALIFTSPSSLTEINSLGVKSIAFILLIVLTLLNLIFGIRVIDHCQIVSDKAGQILSTKFRAYLKAT
ncbi:hypothetical protein ACFJ47_003742 [Vibrio cholerae]